MSKTPLIGIVGGVGPYAGLDLVRKIFDNTLTDGTDQAHLEVLLFSAGRRVPDRTGFILGQAEPNPAQGLFEAVQVLADAGASLLAIACNTAHSPVIFDPLRQLIDGHKLRVDLVHMIEETGLFLDHNFGARARVGLLATQGTIASGVYELLGRKASRDFRLILPSARVRENVHRAIYDREFGIKARSNPVTDQAVELCDDAVAHLAGKGAEAVILGCTELPLALPGRACRQTPLVDPTEATARALVSRAEPQRLKPWSW